jgi:hypothetical protein
MTLAQRGSGPYGLDRPTLNDVRAAIERVHLTETELVWDGLLAGAGLTGEETGPAAVDMLVAAMLASDPVTSLIGRALQIRASSFDHLSAAREIIGSSR